MTLAALVDASEGAVCIVERPKGASRYVLVCEHASNVIPDSLNDLGLDQGALQSHVCWDIGALSVAQRISAALDAPLVFQCFSRLAYDCNRPPDSPSAMPEKSGSYKIPGNQNLSSDDRDARIRGLYEPFHKTLSALLDRRCDETKLPPVLVTVHSFTQNYQGTKREGDLGVLHGDDTRLADILLASLKSCKKTEVRRNYPYGPKDGVMHTLDKQAAPRNLLNVMLEIRNDLIHDEAGQVVWGKIISDQLQQITGKIDATGGHVVRQINV